LLSVQVYASVKSHRAAAGARCVGLVSAASDEVSACLFFGIDYIEPALP
jgi:hypothetical protein